MGNIALITDIRDTLTAAKLTALGAGNSRVLGVSNNATVSENPLTIPGNKPIDSRRGGIVLKGGSGSIVLQGQGIEHPTSNKVHFSGFPNGGVTFVPAAGYRHPSKISTELWDTGNDSETDRINRADTAFADTLPVEIIIPSGRKINSRSALRGGASKAAARTYRFLAGEHFNEWAGAAGADNSVFKHKNNTRFVMDKGGVMWISNEGGQNAATFAPDSSVYFGVMENVHWEGFHFEGVFGQANSGGSCTIQTGNVHGGSMKKCSWKNAADYCFAIGGDPGTGNYAQDFLIEDCFSQDCVTQTFFLSSGKDITFHRLVARVDNLPDVPITNSPYDIEPNTPDDLIERIKFNDCDYHTTLGAPEEFVNPSVVAAQGGATRGIKGLEFRGFIVTAPVNDTSAAQYVIHAEGIENFDASGTKTDGGLGNGLYKIERCRKGLIDGASLKNGVSSRLRIVGSQEFTVRNIDSANGLKQIIEENFYHPVLATATALELFYNWSDNRGRIYEHYEGLPVNLLNTENIVTDTVTPANSDAHVYKSATVTTTVGTGKTAKTFTTFSSNQITLTAHALVTGEPMTFTTAGALAGVPKRVYVIRVDANTIKLATTVANAVAGTAITLSGGSGTHTLTPFYLTAKSVAAADVDTTDNTITFPDHNLVTGSFVQYDNVTGTVIGGLVEALDIYDAGGLVGLDLWWGIYAVIRIDDDTIKLARTRADAIAGTAIDLTSQGTGTHYFIPAARIASTNNKYYVESDWAVELAEDSTSQVFPSQNFNETPVGAMSEPVNTTVGVLDSVKTILAKVIKRVAALEPDPIWYANRFYHFKASDLVGSFDNAESVDVLPTINFVGSGSFELTQATAGLKGKLYLDDGNGSPYLRMDNNQGYAGNEDFPSLAAGFAWALIARVHPSLDLAGYYAALNDNIGGGGSYIDANWVFNTSYGGTTRWNNSGIIGTVATVKNVKEIWLGRTGTHSKLEKNGVDLTTTPTNGETTKPARLNLGNPYTTNSQSAFLDVYEIIFWDDALTDEIGTAFNADNMALQGIS